MHSSVPARIRVQQVGRRPARQNPAGLNNQGNVYGVSLKTPLNRSAGLLQSGLSTPHQRGTP